MLISGLLNIYKLFWRFDSQACGAASRWRNLGEIGPCGRKLGLWAHALQGDFGFLAHLVSFLFFLLNPRHHEEANSLFSMFSPADVLYYLSPRGNEAKQPWPITSENDGAMEIVKSLKSLVHKHEDLSLILRTHVRKPSIVPWACNSIGGGGRPVNTWGSLAEKPSWIHELQHQLTLFQKEGRQWPSKTSKVDHLLCLFCLRAALTSSMLGR